MNLDLALGNLLAWMAQMLVLASAGSLLLAVVRVRHPRTQLVFCHTLLAICLLLPLIEPWRHPVVTIPAQASTEQLSPPLEAPLAALQTKSSPIESPAAAAVTSPPAPAKAEIPLARVALWILSAGVLVKLGWLLAGLFRIRQFRIAAIPLYPVPETIRAASALTHADAFFCVSPAAHGPVMLGWLTPIVLLPEAFLNLSEEAQCGIACHELLHVRRHDWLVTMFEELAGALLWFNPAVWMLLAQTRLAREQLVDEETVLLTSARESYIDALMAIARGKHHLDLAPAPLFLRRRHLAQRMRALLKEVSVSKVRLVFSYSSMTAALALAGWLAFTSFPLTGSPQFRTEATVTQAPAQLPEARPASRPRANSANSSPVPFNAQEPVSGSVRIAETPAERAALLNLLDRASQNSKLHFPGIPPWRFDVSFTALGNSAPAGPGRLTETWFSGQRWRWTVDFGDYSLVRIGSNGQSFEEKHVSSIPMRAQMLREAIFWAVETLPANAQMRSAEILWNGRPTTCVLTSAVMGPAAQTQTRLWEEREECIDNASGLMQVRSIAPGTYFVYDYSGNQQYHGRAEPNRIIIYVAGSLVADAQFALTDAGTVEDRLFAPTPQAIANGPVIATASPSRTSIDVPSPQLSQTQTVMVHAEVDGTGNVIEEELSAASDPAQIQTALDLVRKLNLPHAALTQRQVYVNVRFIPRPQ